MRFRLHAGIDYSGRGTPIQRFPGLQVFANGDDDLSIRINPHSGRRQNWSRHGVAEWIAARAGEGAPFIVGIDHAFGLPDTYLKRYNLDGGTWDEFLTDFCTHWPTHQDDVTVESLRRRNRRTGKPEEFRLTDTWTSSAKSVFLFDVQGQVAKSTHAGIPWLHHIRKEVGDALHFWPFDGWDIPEGKSAVVEVYPSIFRRRYPTEGRTTDEQDAYAIARWLRESDAQGVLDHYLHPPLTAAEKQLARREGWIFGIC